MGPGRAAAALALAATGILGAACASAGPVATGKERSMLERAGEIPAKVVVLEVRGDRATAFLDETALVDIRGTPGVLEADRGARNEALVLVKEETEPSYLVEALRPRWKCTVVRVDRAADLR